MVTSRRWFRGACLRVSSCRCKGDGSDEVGQHHTDPHSSGRCKAVSHGSWRPHTIGGWNASPLICPVLRTRPPLHRYGESLRAGLPGLPAGRGGAGPSLLWLLGGSFRWSLLGSLRPGVGRWSRDPRPRCPSAGQASGCSMRCVGGRRVLCPWGRAVQTFAPG